MALIKEIEYYDYFNEEDCNESFCYDADMEKFIESFGNHSDFIEYVNNFITNDILHGFDWKRSEEYFTNFVNNYVKDGKVKDGTCDEILIEYLYELHWKDILDFFAEDALDYYYENIYEDDDESDFDNECDYRYEQYRESRFSD